MSGLNIELYKQIREDSLPVKIELEGRNYTTKQVLPVRAPAPDAIVVRTLTGLVDYLKTNVDKLVITELVCHVQNPGTVVVRSKLYGDFEQRCEYIIAETSQEPFPFDDFMSAERFNIKLQACFTESPVSVDGELRATDRGLVLKFVGNVKESVVKETGDDGISQEITVRAGVARVEDVVLPNPVILRPYRTFNEVEQPASAFVFRAQDGPRFALFEADNGAWESEAMKNIKDYLESEIPELNVIA